MLLAETWKKFGDSQLQPLDLHKLSLTGILVYHFGIHALNSTLVSVQEFPNSNYPKARAGQTTGVAWGTEYRKNNNFFFLFLADVY